MPKKPTLIVPPFAIISINQKSAGTQMLSTFLADVFTVNRYPFRPFQIDDQQRLSQMIGEGVRDLRPDPNLLMDDPTIATRALTPFYDSVRESVGQQMISLLDSGANQVENVSTFLTMVDYSGDIAQWQLPTIACVPFFPLDPESTAQSTYTVTRLLDAVPNIRLVLIENRHGGSVGRIAPGSIAEANYATLLATAAGADRIVMPAIQREYWAPFEGAGIRFLKVLAMKPEDGALTLNRSIGEIKIMKSAVAQFWREMHAQLSQIISLPEGGK